MSGTCPKCSQPLEAAQVDTCQVRVCRACKGVLLMHADLMAILESSWRIVTPKIAEEMEFHARDGWQSEPILRCPDCGQDMEKYGYMGLAAVQIDRCERCTLVWLDVGELERMTIALARDYCRSGKQNDPSRSMLGALYSVAAAGGSSRGRSVPF